MTHKLSSACAEMILRYHRVPQIFFTHKLVPVTSLLCFCVGVCFFVCGLFLCGFVFGAVFAFAFWCFGFCSF